MVASALLAALTLGACDGSEPLPELGTLPSFELVDQRGQPFGLAEMRGKVWIASFVFTTCPTICPVLSSRMESLQSQLSAHRDDIGLVSFSVDPEHDTPEVLRAYGERFHYDPEMWTWLTGPTDRVSDTVVRGFHLALGEREPTGTEGEYQIMHASKLVLVDRTGEIRGYYDSDDEGTAKLAADAVRLAEQTE